jgi:hypothetical protein
MIGCIEVLIIVCASLIEKDGLAVVFPDLGVYYEEKD